MSRTIRIVAAGLLSMAAFWSLQRLPANLDPRCALAMVRAGQVMEQAILAIRSRRAQSGYRFDPDVDPNRTGLIGPQSSPLVTTLGELSAKRSTTNPNFAGLIVYLLYQSGVRPGNSIAIGSSGSFPALLVASLAAAKALDIRPVTILSLGASSYGASDPDFNLLDIYEVLKNQRICDAPPAAASLGGGQDIGADFESEFRVTLMKGIKTRGITLIHQPDLAQNVAERLRIYERGSQGRIAAFINSGGGYANLGTSLQALDVRPGLNRDLPLPKPAERGMLFEMSARKMPVIHLLYIKGLVSQSGLPWDPIPLPEPGTISIPGGGHHWEFWLLCSTYLALLWLLLRK